MYGSDEVNADSVLPSDEPRAPYFLTSSSLICNRSSSGLLRYLVISMNAGLLLGRGCLYIEINNVYNQNLKRKNSFCGYETI